DPKLTDPRLHRSCRVLAYHPTILGRGPIRTMPLMLWSMTMSTIPTLGLFTRRAPTSTSSHSISAMALSCLARRPTRWLPER
ncbi:unnamed protein product, partial [Mycena citricolor]